LKIQYNRNRYYDYYTGRWTTHDPLGINPAGSMANLFTVLEQYTDGLSLYEYIQGNPSGSVDPLGLSAALKTRAMNAIGAFKAAHSKYEYYVVTGLAITVGKVTTALNNLPAKKYKPNKNPSVDASYDTWFNVLRIQAGGTIDPDTVFHEGIHVHNDIIKKIVNPGDEGLTTFTWYIAKEVLPKLGRLERELNRPQPSVQELRKWWQYAWSYADFRMIPSFSWGAWGTTSKVTFGDAVAAKFHLGFSLTCGGLAGVYNTKLKAKGMGCVQFACTTKMECPDDIPLKHDLHWVFR
jgi:RHS repeat-associated protein